MHVYTKENLTLRAGRYWILYAGHEVSVGNSLEQALRNIERLNARQARNAAARPARRSQRPAPGTVEQDGVWTARGFSTGD